ncbi:MAG: ABC transporter permease [Pyrinomonadaceae bacterium]
MRTYLQELRYAARALRKRPGFSVVVVLTLALGIGANTAIFSVVEAALIRGLPYKNPAALMQVTETVQEKTTIQREASYPDFVDWKTNNHTFESMAGFGPASLIVRGTDAAELIQGGRVTAGFFHVLGVDMASGRGIETGDDEPGAAKVVVLTYAAWQRRFGSNAGLVGQMVTLSDDSYTVVGILPTGFHFAPIGDAEMFVGLNPAPDIRVRRFQHFVNVVGRLNNGVSVEEAQADMNLLSIQIAASDPRGHSNLKLRVACLRDQIVGTVRPVLLLLLIAVAFVLLIACANVANLFLVRSASRRKEMAVRMALGAGRGQLARQLAFESLLLSSIGGLVGLGFAHWATEFLIAAIPASQIARMPYLQNTGLNARVLLFTAGISILCGFVFAIIPALRAPATNLQSRLQEGGRSGGSSVRSPLRNGLVAVEIALTLMLLMGVGLLLKSTVRLLKVDPGFDTRNLLTLRVVLNGSSYEETSHRIAFHERLIQQLQALPGVKNVATTAKLPLSGGGDTGTPIIDGRKQETRSEGGSANLRTVSANYFSTMAVPLVAGRLFSSQDTLDSPRSVIVNRKFVQTFLANDDVINHQIRFIFDAKGKPWTIIGVVGDENVNTLDTPASAVIYFPYSQDPDQVLNVVVRTAQDPLTLAGGVRNQIRSLDAGLPVFGITSMNQIIRDSPSTFARTYPSMLIGVFAAVATLLAAIGLYGVISYSVAQRAHELGLRIALGAQRIDIFRMVLAEGLAVTGLGVAAGLGASFWLNRFLSTLLFGVSPTDPTIIAVAISVLIIISLVALYLPTCRAASVDPLITLRAE